MNRPSLWAAIGREQSRLTDAVVEVIVDGQRRGLLPADLEVGKDYTLILTGTTAGHRRRQIPRQRLPLGIAQLITPDHTSDHVSPRSFEDTP